MELKQLKYFVTIVEEGTISAAARKLHITQPPLSMSIASMEEELGCILFQRGSRKITLTDHGKRIFRYAQEMLEIEKEMEQSINHQDVPIRLGLISSFDHDIFYKALKHYTDKYPKTTFRITEGNTFELMELLEEGRIDLAVIRTPYQQKTLDKVDLSSDHLVAAGLQMKEEYTNLEQLGSKPLIIYRRWESIIREAFSQKNIDPHFICINDDARTCLQWAARGIGTALVPDSCIHLFPNIPISQIPEITTESHLRLVQNKDHSKMHTDARRFFTYVETYVKEKEV